MKLEIGKKYLWVFFIYFSVFCMVLFLKALSDAIPLSLIACSLPVFMAFLLYSQIRSGVALDSWWRATHPAGSIAFKAMIVWNSLAILGMLVMAVLSVRDEFF
ncbi:MAG: hypothetical protein RH917_12350 [Lacipirellulaceae bacterium]